MYPGDAVRAGQVVARLDDVELTSRVREAEAMAATAQANRAQMEADVTASGHGVVQMERELAMVEAELAYASGVRGRSERLVGLRRDLAAGVRERSVDGPALEAKREAARAKLEQARAMETSARRKLDAAESMVTQGRAAERTAQIVRDYVSIVAPTSGLRGQAPRGARACWCSRAWRSSRSPRSTASACRRTSARRTSR